MLKFPLKLEKEEDVTVNLLRELAVIYARNMVKSEGKFLDAQFKFNGEVFITLHDGKVTKGSKASLDFTKDKVWVKTMGD